MAHEHLTAYLNDHLAGAVVALELLEHLEAIHSHDGLCTFFSELHADVAADRKELESIMVKLNIDQSRTRKTVAWLGEKMTELKLRYDDPRSGDLLLFESMEALSLGIEGKRSLWIALATAATNSTPLQLADYDLLQQRAQEQRDRVERLRAQLAPKALALDHTQ